MNDTTLYINSFNSSNIITFESHSSNTILKLGNFKIHSENKTLMIKEHNPILIINNENITFNSNIIPLNNIKLGHSNSIIYCSNIMIQNENLFSKIEGYLDQLKNIELNHLYLNRSSVPEIPLFYNAFLSNQTFKVVIQNIHSSPIESNYIILNPCNNVILFNDNIISIKSANLLNQSNYNIIIGSSNVFGSIEYIINVVDYLKEAPKYINISNLDLFLSNQTFIFDYNDYFTGLMQHFYIVSNPVIENILTFNDDYSISISNQSIELNHYHVVIGTSNLFGSNNFTFYITNS